MNLRKGVVTVVALAVLAAVGYGIWRQTGGLPRASAGTALIAVPPGLTIPTLGFSPGPPITPRLVATWATHVGPYSVGVSSVRPMQDNRRLMGRSGAQMGRGGLGPFHVTLQVLGEEDAAEGVEIDVGSVRLTDDSGAILKCEPAAPSADNPVKFPGGLGYVLPFPAPSPQASMLRIVEGELILPSGDRRAFRIKSIPFPLQRVTRLFGRLAPRRLSSKDEARLPEGLAVLGKEAAESVLSRSETLTGALANTPQRLVFTQSIPANVGIPTPLEPDSVVMMASEGQMGSLDLDIRFGTEAWRGKLWENDTILVALPRRGQEPRRAAAIRLSRYSAPNGSPSTSPPTFLPEPGRPGGAIVSKVLVAGRPFGDGIMQVELRQLRGEVWSEPRVANAPIDRDGILELPNIAPGIYSLRRPGSRVTPEMPFAEPSVPLHVYLSGRFGVRAGKWQGESVDRIEVRKGQLTEIEPLSFIPSDVKPR